jgi:uncharacterized membrane protein
VSLLIYVAFRIYTPTPLVAALFITPMSIFQFSSASLDGIISAISILAISIFMRIVADKKNSEPWLLHGLTASVICVATSKVHLLPLILLIFFTFLYTKSKKSFIAGGVASVLVALWLIVAISTTVDGRISTGFSVSNILFHYIGNPLDFIWVVLRTISDDAFLTFLVRSFFGNLGWLDAPFPENVYKYLYVLFFLTLIFSMSLRKIKTEWPERALLAFCALSSVLLIFLALLVTWTVHPATFVHGLQGRYFLIPAFLIAYALKGSLEAKPSYLNYCGMAILPAILLFSIFNTSELLLNRYYLSLGIIYR